MEQRPLRLGDIVDDYCPRERRVTNHAVVALVEDAIRQTRCTTCDAEHIYKGGQEPRRKLVKKDAGIVAGAMSAGGADDVESPPAMAAAASSSPEASDNAPAMAEVPDAIETPRDDTWPAHRQLIRATLPRTDGEPPQPRPIPEFTMHQRQTRGAHAFRQNWYGGGGGAPPRDGRPARDGQGNGFGGGRPGGGGGGGRHRHRGRGGKKTHGQ